ncbi:MAG: chromosome partitioning protein ParA, partial [Tannerella sp.]|nr:chromosome partitioning protein ParA [Tannerella sp.]
MDKLSENLIAQPHSDRAEATGGETELSLTDILQTVKAHWPWFLLSLFICLGVAAFYIAGASKVYSRTATVLIKDDSKGGGALSESTAFEDLNLFDIKRNVDNEVIVFQSEALMRQVVKRLHLDLSYSRHEGLRQVELYTASPVRLDFPDASPEQSFALVATPWDEKHVLLSGFSGAPYARPLKVLLGDTVQTPLGHVICYPTLSYGKDSFHHPIEVEKSNFELVLQHYHSALKSTLASKTATIVDLSLEDASAQRAEDVLNTLISVYNEAAIADKNQIMVNTAKFIQKRLAIINQELGGVDSDLANFMSENQLTDLKSQTGVYLEQGSQYNKEELQLINQRQMAQYVRDYLASPAHRASLIPANTGIGGQQGNNSDVEQQIGEYNTQLLKRNRLLSVSSDRNPVVQDLNTSLEAMRENIVRTVDNLIVGLNLRIRNTQARDKQNTRRIIQMPDQQKQMATIERQQKIKASLYLYLLNKREENAISQAMTENNARIVDPAVGPANPVAPRPRIILAFAFLLGLALPAGVLWLRDVSDTKVRGRKDLEDALAVPFLGEIPLRRPTRKEKKNKQKHFFVRANGHDPLSESFRILRTNMEFMRAGAPELKCVMFTSQVPGSGKTFMSINLALSL